MYYNTTNTQSSTQSSIENNIPPYSLYWTRYKQPCFNKSNSFFQLNMKRKALTLQHNNTHTQQKKTVLFIKAVKNKNRMNNRYAKKNVEPQICNRYSTTTASQSNVPGNKGFILYDNPSVPIYNYIPVKRTYQGGNNKYPYTTWKYGMRGFPVGKKGTTEASRQAAREELLNNPEKYSRSTTYNGCFNIICTNKKIIFNLDISNILTLNNPHLLDSPIIFLPINLNPEYTTIKSEGEIWYCSSSKWFSDLSYIYFLTNHKDKWWFSISKNNKYNIKMINDTKISEYKNLAYIMYASYPFIEFNLNLLNTTNTNIYKFNVSKIFFQTAKVVSDISTIKLRNAATKYFDFCSNYCLLNSPTVLYFNKSIISSDKPVLQNTFWWRKNQASGSANIFDYSPIHTYNDNNTNLELSAHINKYYSVCTTYQTFSGDFYCQE